MRRTLLLQLSRRMDAWRQAEREGKLRFERPALGWMRTIRDAIGMSGWQLARRMGLRQPTVARLEQNERKGTITIRSLERAAHALGCDLVYAFVPRESLVERVDRQARRAATLFLGGDDRTEAVDIEFAAHELLLRRRGIIWGCLEHPELLDAALPGSGSAAAAAGSGTRRRPP